MITGYARISTLDQDLNLQRQALIDAGCKQIFEDRGQSGSKRDRPELDRCLAHLSTGDTLIVWKLDRLARSLSHLLELMNKFNQLEVDLKSLTEAIDTTTPNGRLMFSICGAFAEFERSLIIERTNAGLAIARQAGSKFGRPRIKPDQIQAVDDLRELGYSRKNACSVVGISETGYWQAKKRSLNQTNLKK